MKTQLLYLVLFFLCQDIIAQNPAAIDPSFVYTTGANSNVIRIMLQTDNKIILAGAFTTYNGVSANQIIRLYPTGSKDNSFNSGSGVSGVNSFIQAIAIQSDGKILIGGNFSIYDGTPANYIARLNSNGTIDTTFQTAFGANDQVLTIDVLQSGKILIGGYFTSYDGTSINRIARLNANGSLDASFLVGTGIEGSGSWIGVLTTIIQPDGKIVLGGNFNSYNGTICHHITRINSNGSVDNTFLMGALVVGGNLVSSTLQPDGKIIFGGAFTSYNGTAIRKIGRLYSNGTLDNTFTATVGPDASVYAMGLQQDGKLVIGGYFTIYNGLPSNGLARLNSDRTIDNSFNVGIGTNGTGAVNEIIIQPDGKILFSGSFTSYNGVSRYMIARLNGSNPQSGVSEVDFLRFLIYPNPTTGKIIIELGEIKTDLKITLANSLGQVVLIQNYDATDYINLEMDYPKGMYFLTLETEGEVLTKKIIIE